MLGNNAVKELEKIVSDLGIITNRIGTAVDDVIVKEIRTDVISAVNWVNSVGDCAVSSATGSAINGAVSTVSNAAQGGGNGILNEILWTYSIINCRKNI